MTLGKILTIHETFLAPLRIFFEKQNKMKSSVKIIYKRKCDLKMDVLISAVSSSNRAWMAASWKEFKGN